MNKSARVVTAYSGPQATIYDEKRFSEPKGQLFQMFEIGQLESVLTRLPPQQRILEVGCGTGRFMRRSLKGGHKVHGLDPSPEMLLSGPLA